MTSKTQPEADNRVVPIRPRIGGRMFSAPDRDHPSVEGIEKYARAHDHDDYRHRMTMNAAALAVTVVLMLIGLWLATSIAQMRKNQDCVLSGRRGCTPVTAPPSQRW